MISNQLEVPPDQEEDLSFSSIHRDPDTSISHPAFSPSPSGLDPSSFFLPPDPTQTTDDDENPPNHHHFLSSSEMSSSQPWSSSASTEGKSSLISSPPTSARHSGAQTSHSLSSSSSSSQSYYRPQFQQGGPRGSSSFRPGHQYPPYRLPSPSGPPDGLGFTRRPPPLATGFPLHQQQHLQPLPYNPRLHSSPSSPSGPNYGYGGGLPGVEGPGGGGGAEGEGGAGGGGRAFPGAPTSPFPRSYGLPLQPGYYPPGSSSSAASSPGGYPTSNSFDPRNPSPTPSSLDASPNRSPSASSSSNRYRHQPPPHQGYGSHNQNLRPPFSPYQHRSPAPPPAPPHSFYQPNLYQSPLPPSSTPGGPSHPNAMQPHTVQGPDGQTWAYFPVPVASGYYGQPLAYQGGAAAPPYPVGMGVGPYGLYGSGGYPYGAGGLPSSSGPSPHPSSPSPLNVDGLPFPTPFPPTSSPILPQGPSLLGFNPLSPSSRPIPTGPSSSISPRSNLSHSPSNLSRKPYHPPPPATRSEWVMWCGNVPSDATQDELDAFFNSQSVVPNSISSIFNISRSQCCFVNFNSQEALESGIAKFNGIPIRPDEGVRSARLVCRVRRKEDDLKAGVGAQRGRGVHTGWVREKQQQQQQLEQVIRERENKEGGEEVASIAETGVVGTVDPPTAMRSRPHQGSTGSTRTISSQASTDSSFLSKNFPVRYFILKSLTSVDLETSVQRGLWATQVHNEQTLDQAYRTSKDVILIFGANKTGEFFGYAKMASGISKSERRISWASRESGSGSVKSPTSPSRTTFSPSVHPSVQHRGSAPERIVEDVEDESGSNGESSSAGAAGSEHVRAASNPPAGRPSSSTSLPVVNHPESEGFKTNGGLYLFPEVRASPGEISPGEESKYSSLGSDLSTPSTSTKPPTLLTKVLDRDGRGERVSAPADLERRLSTSPKIVRPVQGLTLDPADLSRLRVNDGSPSSPTSPLSASSNINLQPPSGRLSTASGVEDEDGVTRKDYSRSSVSSNSTRFSTSAGSGVSRASMVLPNLHLPPSPTTVALPGEGGKRRTFATAGGEGGEVAAVVWGTPFKVEWIRTTRLPFQQVKHLQNPWNQNRDVKISRDGTEVEPEVGRRLLEAWDAPMAPPKFPSNITSPPPGTPYNPNQFVGARPPPLNYNRPPPPPLQPPALGLSMGPPQQYLNQWGEFQMGR